MVATSSQGSAKGKMQKKIAKLSGKVTLQIIWPQLNSSSIATHSLQLQGCLAQTFFTAGQKQEFIACSFNSCLNVIKIDTKHIFQVVTKFMLENDLNQVLFKLNCVLKVWNSKYYLHMLFLVINYLCIFEKFWKKQKQIRTKKKRSLFMYV